MKTFSLVLILFVFVVGAIFAIQQFSKAYNCGTPLEKTAEVRTEAAIIVAEVAETPHERRCGLSERDALAADRGLLLVFEKDDRHGIWMKDVRFPLDIVWLDGSLKTVHIQRNVTPDTYPIVFYPSEKARMVLEVNAGVAEEAGIIVGESLEVDIVE